MRLLRHALIATAGRLAPRLWRYTRRRPSLTVLMYHRVLPPDDPRLADEQPGMVVHPQTLRRHLRLLRRQFQPMHLADWLHRLDHGAALPDRACAVTFDDGWHDNWEHAFPVLCAEEFPATLFLVADLIGTRRGFWPGRLATALRAAAREPAAILRSAEFAWLAPLGIGQADLARLPDPTALDRVVVACKRLPDPALLAHLAAMEQRLGIDAAAAAPELLDWDQVARMRASGLVDIGSHTCRHLRLTAAVAPAEVEREVAESRRTIGARTGVEPELFCYPNGDWSPAARAAVARHYRGAVTTAPGWNGPQTDRYLLRRVSMHEGVGGWRFWGRVGGWDNRLGSLR